MTPAGPGDDRSRTRGEIEKEGRRRSSRLWTSGVRSMFEARACVPAWTIGLLMDQQIWYVYLDPH